ncbi:MAG: hypothetical protein LBE03_01565, partial [Candidatus Nomurabacteria bacterium]|nr:hypothetical protein [Candidatus Nomurabacteria bacterium]
TTGVDYSNALCKTAPLTSSILNAYHRGSVIATADTVGGIIGSAKADDNEITVHNVYQTCSVSSTTGRAGGIIGDISITNQANSSLDIPRDGSLTLTGSVSILEYVTPITSNNPETTGRTFGRVNNLNLLTLSNNYGWNGEKVILSNPPTAGEMVRDDFVESDKDGVSVSGLDFATDNFFSSVFAGELSNWTTGVGKLGILSAIPAAVQNDGLPDCMATAGFEPDIPNTDGDASDGDVNVPNTGRARIDVAWAQKIPLVVVTATIMAVVFSLFMYRTIYRRAIFKRRK